MSEEVILEPGDPGYVDPNAEPVEPAPVEPGPIPNQIASPGETGQDLSHQQQAGESYAEFMQRTRSGVVQSQSPTDTVPNMPQTTMGVQVPVGDTGLVTGVPPEVLESPEEGDAEPAAEEEVPAEEPTA